MEIKLEELNIRISNEILREQPGWFKPELVFDFPIEVKAGNIVLNKDYSEHTVVVWLWKSWAPTISEKRVGEVYFGNNGTEKEPEILTAAKLI